MHNNKSSLQLIQTTMFKFMLKSLWHLSALQRVVNRSIKIILISLPPMEHPTLGIRNNIKQLNGSVRERKNSKEKTPTTYCNAIRKFITTCLQKKHYLQRRMLCRSFAMKRNKEKLKEQEETKWKKKKKKKKD